MATIVICTQEDAARRRIAMALELAGHHVVETRDGEEAWEKTRSSQPELVLVDLMMPHPGGYQLVRRISFEQELPQPRVIFLAAAHMESEARLLARTCGSSRLVADIADTDGLLASVAAALAGPPPSPGEPWENDEETSALYPVVTRLYQRVTELQSFNVRLGRHAAMGAAQLQVARAALKREVIKRLRTEQAMLLENQRLRDQSMRDPLTGLYSRRYFEESLGREQSRAERSGKPLGVMMISVDQFRHCSETHGQAAEDVVLRSVAQCIQSHARREDMVCRYDGGEFVLVMTDTSPGMLKQRASALSLNASRLYIEHDQRRIEPISVSIGLASFPAQADSAPAVLQAATRALRRAQASGHERVASAPELSAASA